MTQGVLRTLIPCLLLVSAPLSRAADIYTPYRVDYEVTRNDMVLGKAHYRLSEAGDDCYIYEGYAVPEGLAALLVPSTVERSEFCTGTEDGIVPVSYRMWQGAPDEIRKLDDAVANDGDDDVDDRNYRVLFSDNGTLARTNGLPAKTLNGSIVDNSSLHFAIRNAVAERLPDDDRSPFTVNVFKENKLKQYSFRIAGYDVLKTAAGKFKTVRAERTDHKKKRLLFWLATEHDLLPVRVTRSKKGGSNYTLTLHRIQ